MAGRPFHLETLPNADDDFYSPPQSPSDGCEGSDMLGAAAEDGSSEAASQRLYAALV